MNKLRNEQTNKRQNLASTGRQPETVSEIQFLLKIDNVIIGHEGMQNGCIICTQAVLKISRSFLKRASMFFLPLYSIIK